MIGPSKPGPVLGLGQEGGWAGLQDHDSPWGDRLILKQWLQGKRSHQEISAEGYRKRGSHLARGLEVLGGGKLSGPQRRL